MRITFDCGANAAYTYRAEEGEGQPEGGRTVVVEDAHMKGMINLNLKKHGRLLGIEIVGATRLLRYSYIHHAERI